MVYKTTYLSADDIVEWIVAQVGNPIYDIVPANVQTAGEWVEKVRTYTYCIQRGP